MLHEITIGEFNHLNHDEKSWYLWHGATYLHAFEKGGYRVNLFHMNHYYIELWYHLESNSIDEIRAFNSTDMLEPFLEHINIEIPIRGV